MLNRCSAIDTGLHSRQDGCICGGYGGRQDAGADDGKFGKSRERLTIYDLAQIAGASPSAVSSILNGSWKKRRISAKTAARVSKIAAEQRYAVNLQASMLRRERSHVIGMIAPKYDNRYFGAIAEQFAAMARARGLFPVITWHPTRPRTGIRRGTRTGLVSGGMPGGDRRDRS